MKDSIQELNSHFNNSHKNYDIKGESHIEYYRGKYPERYEKLDLYHRTFTPLKKLIKN